MAVALLKQLIRTAADLLLKVGREGGRLIRLGLRSRGWGGLRLLFGAAGGRFRRFAAGHYGTAPSLELRGVTAGCCGAPWQKQNHTALGCGFGGSSQFKIAGHGEIGALQRAFKVVRVPA